MLNFRLSRLALQNVKKDYIIFSYFRNFVAKSDQKTKEKWDEQNTIVFALSLSSTAKYYCLLMYIQSIHILSNQRNQTFNNEMGL